MNFNFDYLSASFSNSAAKILKKSHIRKYFESFLHFCLVFIYFMISSDSADRQSAFY